MKLFNKFLVFILIPAFLTACVTKYEIVEKTRYIYTPVGVVLTTSILPPSPPIKSDYLAADQVDRATMLTSYSMDLLAVTKALNDRLDTIHRNDINNFALINKFNTEEENRVNGIVGKSIKAIKNTK